MNVIQMQIHINTDPDVQLDRFRPSVDIEQCDLIISDVKYRVKM